MRNAFSMIELVFVIVIIGIIAAIAIPKLSVTRADAQYVAVQSDIQTILSSIQAKSLTEDIDSSTLNGDFIMETAGLNPTRWIPTANGVRLAKDGAVDNKNNCVLIDFSSNTLDVKIDKTITSPLCQKLAQIYTKPITISFGNGSIKL
ncbi:prepilin-type N-terminal cleavage/methylation domain-containing protein [Helicobacter cappadocius]|uniref:Prepilin-type N-terminal cleavage/methylation domain-containing protein n=1 Tax=Helicobacter cappadocius TaxID=3063998 RepID=A0AA90T4K2_9HELI|nr:MULTISPECIES: prepilin-type N-terminal cleavage/methylation domain-containing protein [unclassified Helicobacter]MDO7252536.1 prepilin-type N-terminal cleavage/methylation domain-containing protein [Helicobacter sp. faydin-H75]MDP2538403.1 prepilin-type N-terminal cleavage/methylation domain-containing protein [Helicobacter sp. faydin-H76]